MIEETAQRSYHGPLGGLPNAVSGPFRPKENCIGEPAKQGADHSSFGKHGRPPL